MKKVQDAGFRLVETPVHHYHRAYGKSQFFNFRRLIRVARDLTKLWIQMVVKQQHLQPASELTTNNPTAVNSE